MVNGLYALVNNFMFLVNCFMIHMVLKYIQNQKIKKEQKNVLLKVSLFHCFDIFSSPLFS